MARAELSAYKDYQDALESGDALAIRSTKAAWLSITETLRKAGAQLDANELELGDMVPRSVVEKFITAVGNALRCACHTAPDELTGENMMRLGAPQAAMILQDQLFMRFHAAFAAVLQIPHGAPKWMTAQLLEGELAEVQQWWKEHADVMKEWIGMHDRSEFLRHVEKECFERKSTAEWLAHLEECRAGNFKTLPSSKRFFS